MDAGGFNNKSIDASRHRRHLCNKGKKLVFTVLDFHTIHFIGAIFGGVH